MTSTANLRQNVALNLAVSSLYKGPTHNTIDLHLFHCCSHADIVNNNERTFAWTTVSAERPIREGTFEFLAYGARLTS